MRDVSLAHRKQHIHRVLTDDRGQRSALWADHITFGDIGPTDLARDRRYNIGVAKIDICRVQFGLGNHDLGIGVSVRSQRLVARLDRARTRLGQGIRTLVFDRGQQLLCLVVGEFPASLVSRDFELILLNSIKMLAFLDKIALLEQHVFQVAGDSGVNFDFIDRLDPPHKIFSFSDRLVFGLDRADRNRSRCLLLRRRRSDRGADHKTNADCSARCRLNNAFPSRPPAKH